jgi:alkylation response protein AidB-like acyl-CoA dehydrogenase
VELRWCQGFSEPGAGSDLASRDEGPEDKATTARNGSKISLLLARTSLTGASAWSAPRNTDKHEGISFLLIDMRSPGVEARPILLINGTTPFCETFFTDVKVPRDEGIGYGVLL